LKSHKGSETRMIWFYSTRSIKVLNLHSFDILYLHITMFHINVQVCGEILSFDDNLFQNRPNFTVRDGSIKLCEIRQWIWYVINNIDGNRKSRVRMFSLHSIDWTIFSLSIGFTKLISKKRMKHTCLVHIQIQVDLLIFDSNLAF
jgi:hypothetical protein